MVRLRQVMAGAIALTILAAVPQVAAAQDEGSKFGIGFQSSFPAYGISGLYDVSEQITAQAVLGLFGSLTTISGRGLYHFNIQPKYNLFGFGTVGFWRYNHPFGIDDESTIGLGGGAGIELDWEAIVTNDGQNGTFPPLYSTFDIGLTYAGFDVYDFSAFMLGVGLHYRF